MIDLVSEFLERCPQVVVDVERTEILGGVLQRPGLESSAEGRTRSVGQVVGLIDEEPGPPRVEARLVVEYMPG